MAYGLGASGEGAGLEATLPFPHFQTLLLPEMWGPSLPCQTLPDTVTSPISS